MILSTKPAAAAAAITTKKLSSCIILCCVLCVNIRLSFGSSSGVRRPADEKPQYVTLEDFHSSLIDSEAYYEAMTVMSSMSNHGDHSHNHSHSNHEIITNTNEVWKDHMEQTWSYAFEEEDRQRRSRKLQQDTSTSTHRKDTSLDVTSINASPFLICVEEESRSGYDRRVALTNDVQEDLESIDPEHVYAVMTEVISNSYQRTCFRMGLGATVARDLPKNHPDRRYTVTPISPLMKMRDGTVDRLRPGENDRVEAVRLVVSIGPWIEFDHGSFGIEDMAENLDAYTRSHCGNSESVIGQNPDRRRTRESLKSSLMHKRWDEGLRTLLESDCDCGIMFEGLWYTTDDNDRTISFIFSSQPFSDIPLIFDEDDVNYNCILSFIALISQRREVTAVTILDGIQLQNLNAQWIMQTNIDGDRPWFEVGLNGKDQIISMSDTGVDVDNCYFYDTEEEVDHNQSGETNLDARKIIQYYTHMDDGDYLNGHGTHVAGILVGKKAENGKDESNGLADGIAPAAKLAVFDMGRSDGSLSLPGSLSSPIARGLSAGAYIHNGSWGRTAGYDVISKSFDSYVYENPDVLVVLAAGNTGFENREQTILEPANAKNVLAVGAGQSANNDLYRYDWGRDYVAYFSSRGPTRDDRIKPDIIAPGRTILSAGSRPDVEGECDPSSMTTPPSVGTSFGSDEGLSFQAGTSMASPVASGTAALIRQYFVEGYYPSGVKNSNDSITPSASLIKALLINGADELLGVDNVGRGTVSTPYDNAQGFGRPNLIKSLFLSGATDTPVFTKVWDRKEIDNGETFEFQATIDRSGNCESEHLSATLTWIDPPGESGCKSCLMNDLDLVLINNDNDQETFPNGNDDADDINNVERVRVQVDSGDVYTVRVEASNLAYSSAKYSLVVTGCLSGSVGLEYEEVPIPPPSPSPTRSPTKSPTKLPTRSPTESPTIYIAPRSDTLSPTLFNSESPSELPFDNVLSISDVPEELINGIMFDTSVTDEIMENEDISEIKITGIDITLRGTQNNTVEVWYILGESHIGNEAGNRRRKKKKKKRDVNRVEVPTNNTLENDDWAIEVDSEAKVAEEKWKLLCSSFVLANNGIAAPIENFQPLTIPADGSLSAFYITLNDSDLLRLYATTEENNAGDTYTANDSLLVTVGTSIRYSFKNPEPGYVLNGNIHYESIFD